MSSEILGWNRKSTEEERELAASCGAEEEALMRRTLPGIPHEQYRVLIMREVAKVKNPTTKDYAVAKSKVDRALVEQNMGIIIPAARPGRVTR